MIKQCSRRRKSWGLRSWSRGYGCFITRGSCKSSFCRGRRGPCCLPVKRCQVMLDATWGIARSRYGHVLCKSNRDFPHNTRDKEAQCYGVSCPSFPSSGICSETGIHNISTKATIFKRSDEKMKYFVRLLYVHILEGSSKGVHSQYETTCFHGNSLVPPNVPSGVEGYQRKLHVAMTDERPGWTESCSWWHGSRTVGFGDRGHLGELHSRDSFSPEYSNNLMASESIRTVAQGSTIKHRKEKEDEDRHNTQVIEESETLYGPHGLLWSSEASGSIR